VNYFFDENFSPPLVRAISALHSRDNENDSITYARAMDFAGVWDPTWINALGQHGDDWTILSHDRMRRERQLVQTSRFTWFIFDRGWSNLKFWDESWKLVKAWPDIVEACRRSPGQVYSVSVSGARKNRRELT
jgi:hypothetical protein